MSINFRRISFVKETADSNSIIGQYEDKIMKWVEKSDENKKLFISSPIEVAQQITGKEDIAQKISSAISLPELPFKERYGLDAQYTIGESEIVYKTVTDTPANDYTYGWDCTASAKIDILNQYIASILSTVFPIYKKKIEFANGTISDLEIDVCKIVSALTGNLSLLTLQFPITNGKVEIQSQVIYLKGCSLYLTVKLEEINISNGLENELCSFYLNIQDPKLVQNIKINNPNYPEYDYSVLAAIIKTALNLVFKNIDRILIYQVDLAKHETLNNLIKNHNYLFPTEAYFAAAVSPDANNSCLSALIQTVDQNENRQITTSPASIPSGADIGLNISNDLFFGRIMLDGLIKGFSQYNSELTQDSFSVIQNNGVTVGIRMNDGEKIKVPVDNCPDIYLSDIMVMVNSNEEIEITGNIKASAAHFFEISGSFNSKFKFVIKDDEDDKGNKIQIVQLSALGEPVVDVDCDLGFLSYLLITILMAGGILGIIAAVVVGVINLIINDQIDNICQQHYKYQRLVKRQT